MKREWKESLWDEYVKGTIFSEEKKKSLKAVGDLLIDKAPFLYEIYAAIGKEGKQCKDEESGVAYEKADGLHILKWEETEICFEKDIFKTVVSDMIGLFEELLPLGSVVDLKKDKLAENMDVSKIDNFRVVIVKRFVGDGESLYYPYGAVVYPFGTAGAGRVMSFTPALIDRVIFTGYSDEVEEAFVYQMKHELIVSQRRMSAGFASKERLAEFEKNIMKAGERDARYN